MAAEIRDVAPGLWLFRAKHPHWRPGLDWEEVVTTTVVESGGEVFVIDPPADAGTRRRRGLEAARRPAAGGGGGLEARSRARRRRHHRPLRRARFRAAPLLARRRPEGAARAIEPGSRLPGGLVALYDGRGRSETPLRLPEQKTIVFADALCAQGGELQIWWSPAFEKRALPALRELLELPFERVVVSHGEPVHSRAAFERALARPPYRD